MYLNQQKQSFFPRGYFSNVGNFLFWAVPLVTTAILGYNYIKNTYLPNQECLNRPSVQQGTYFNDKIISEENTYLTDSTVSAFAGDKVLFLSEDSLDGVITKAVKKNQCNSLFP